MASRVPHPNEMSPTVQTEADIDCAVAPAAPRTQVGGDEVEDTDGSTIPEHKDHKFLGSEDAVAIVVTDDGCTSSSNNNSASMKCLNFVTSSTSHVHAAVPKGCMPTNITTPTVDDERQPSPPLASATSNQFVNHSFSCREMGTSGSVAANDADAVGRDLAQGLVDVVRVSTSVPQPAFAQSELGAGGRGATGTSFHSATAAAVAAVAMTAAAAAAAASAAATTAVTFSSRANSPRPNTPETLGVGEPPVPATPGSSSPSTNSAHPVHNHPLITISDPSDACTTTSTTTSTTNPNRASPDECYAGVQTCDRNQQHHHHHHHPTVGLPSVSIDVPLGADQGDDASDVPASASNPYYSIVPTNNTCPMATNTVTGRCSKPPLHSYQQHYQSYHHHHVLEGALVGRTPVASGGSAGPVPMVAGGGTYHRPHSARFMSQHIKILPKTQSLDLADNDDILEASNRSESQLEISAAGIVPQALKGRVLPKLQTLDQTTRPIYPNVPYSPYNSPYGSPRSGRRRTPLRESRRVSIEQSGSFLQLNQYKLLDQIGQGSYGLVKLAYSEEDSTHYAMKILSKRKLLRKAGLMRRGPKRGTSPLDRVYREIAVLKKLDHPNVVKLVEVLDDPLEDSLYLVFELVQQGEVLSIPTDTPLSEERAWNVFRDVLLGVEYLHYQRIIHGDLKPANLLLSDAGSVKVADLGVCNEFLGEDAAMNNGSTAGTPAFRAPETLLPGQHFYNGKAADIWALGATLYSLVHGNVPFIATSVPGVYEKIKNDPLEYPATSTISEELRDLIGRMLDKDPQQRITLPQIKEHPWLTKLGTIQLPTEEENCRLVQINDEDMNSVVKSIPKLDTLILIKTMLKKHSFQNPFTKGISGRAPQAGGSRLERFCRSGRSNSAPGDYHTSERQPSNESLLPSVTEGVTSPLGSPEPTGSIISEMDSLTLRSDLSNPSSSTDTDTTTVKIVTTPPE
ncbi:serine/threonine-protein kinase PAK 5 [Anopheles ziemanni]|uniref:serine/threonine-protein kinase PAK 5 n=1 Tax=Anopheles coustani TaxID=139045 RepID=UPI002659A6D1|nr:serine/threonine-protein kinase PAK 5 [Anopheles coustani]XP_058169478.1 serine/threonine-protein kinase PAK 5 [Anopheles ziemanni]